MAEELKPEEKKEEKKVEVGKIISTILKVILGLILLALGCWLIWIWRKDLILVIKGCLGPFLVLAGIITLAIARE